MNRNVAIGCAVVFLLLAAVLVVAVMQVPKLLHKGAALVMQTVADESRLAALEQAWSPPTPTPDGTWFPSTIGEWKLERSEPRTGIPELKIDRAGQHATYRTGAGPIEVDVIPANDLEHETMVSHAEDALKNRQEVNTDVGGVHVSVNSGGTQWTTTSGNRKHVRIGNEDHTRFWWVKGTLFIFRACGAADSEAFPEEYLRAISPTTPPVEPKLERP